MAHPHCRPPPQFRKGREVVEPASWSQVAYTSLLWWASAGDTRAGLSEAEQSEQEMDLALLDSDQDGDGRTKEIVLIGYFRRLTGMLFNATARIVQGVDVQNKNDNEPAGTEEDADEDGDDGRRQNGEEDEQRLLLSGQNTDSDSDEALDISSEDMSAMGLDMWSTSDKQFIQDFLYIWWGRQAKIRGMGVECCGVKII